MAAMLPMLAAMTAAPQAWAGAPGVVWAKSGVSSRAMATELDACVVESKSFTISALLTPAQQNIAVSSGIAGALGAGITGVLEARADIPKVRADYVESCMRGRGFAAIPLSTQEQNEVGSQATPDAARAWMDRFYGRDDFAKRLADAVLPPPATAPRLPQADHDPMAIDSIRMDANTLTPASGVVGTGQVLLSGKASHRAVARVVNDVEFRNVYRYRVPAGTWLQQVVADGDEGRSQTYWCGQIIVGLPFKDAKLDHCVWDDGRRFVVQSGLGQYGLFTRPGGSMESTLSELPYKLDVSGSDPFGPLDFVLVLQKVGVGGVILLARAGPSQDKTTPIWTGQVLFDDSGKAVLPFGAHSLTLVRDGEGVRATLTEDGEGKGWNDANAGAVW